MTNQPYRPDSDATRAKRVASAKQRHVAERAAKVRHVRFARKAPPVSIDLMTGQIWDGPPNWPDGCKIIPFPGKWVTP